MSLALLSKLNNNSLNNLNKNIKNNSLSNSNYNLNNSSNYNLNNSSNYSLSNSNSNYSKKNILLNKNKSLHKKVKIEKNYELIDFPKQGISYGTYKGTTPKQAAKKAFSKLARSSNLNNSNQKFIVFVIRQKKPNKKGIKREFKYMGQRVKLERGIEIKRGNKTVTIKYKNIVNKFKDLNH